MDGLREREFGKRVSPSVEVRFSDPCDGSALSAQRSHTHGAPCEHARERIVLSGSFIHTHPRKQITTHSRPGIGCPFGRCIRTIHVIDVVCMIARSFYAFVGNGGRLPDRRHSVDSETSEEEKRSHTPQGVLSIQKGYMCRRQPRK